MPTYTDTNVNQLVINKMTKAQYESITPSDTELYLVPDEIDTTPTSGSDNPITSGGVYTALDDKIDKPSTAGNLGQVLTSDGQGGQSWQTPTSGVSDVTVGGTSVVTNGVAAVPAIPTVPTISTNVASDKADNTKTTGAKAVYDEVHPAVVTTQPSGGFTPNIVYQLGTLTGSVTFALASPSDSSIANYYYWSFDSGSTAPTITWPSGITWLDGTAPTINASKHYEISIVGGIASCLSNDGQGGGGGGSGVTDVTVGGTSVVSGGVAVIPAIPTVPTISTDIVSDKASDVKTASPKAVYDEIHPAVVTTQPAGGFAPNVLYNLGTLTGAVTFAMASAGDSSVMNHWYWTFDTSSTAPTVTWPQEITSWLGGSAPTINASKHYEISVLNGIGVAMEV